MTTDTPAAPLYSWCGTPIQFHISDENAEAYNRVNKAIEEGTISLSPGSHPRSWWIWMNANRADMDIYNKVADVINKIIELNGGSLPYYESDFVEVSLIKVQ